MQVEGERECLHLTTTGARVRNAYGTYLYLGNSPWKRGLIPHSIISLHDDLIKEFRIEMAMRIIS